MTDQSRRDMLGDKVEVNEANHFRRKSERE